MNAATRQQRQDDDLALVMERAARALSSVGLTVEDVLAELPDVQAELMREWYGEEFVAMLEQAARELQEPGEQ